MFPASISFSQYDAEWEAEIARRAQRAKKGETTGVPFDEVRKKIERKLGL